MPPGRLSSSALRWESLTVLEVITEMKNHEQDPDVWEASGHNAEDSLWVILANHLFSEPKPSDYLHLYMAYNRESKKFPLKTEFIKSVGKKPIDYVNRPLASSTPSAQTRKRYCYCQKTYNSSDPTMVGCDFCNGWYHTGCLAITSKKAKRLKTFKCPTCSGQENAAQHFIPEILLNRTMSESLPTANFSQSHISFDASEDRNRNLCITHAERPTNQVQAYAVRCEGFKSVSSSLSHSNEDFHDVCSVVSEVNEDSLLNSGNNDPPSSSEENEQSDEFEEILIRNRPITPPTHNDSLDSSLALQSPVSIDESFSDDATNQSFDLGEAIAASDIPPAVLQVMGATEEDLRYTPDKEFVFEMTPSAVESIIEWDSEGSPIRFKPHGWRPDFEDAFKTSIYSCGFKAPRSPFVYSRSNYRKAPAFAKFVGQCNCSKSFVILAINVPTRTSGLKFYGVSSGEFQLVQTQPTGTRLSGSHRRIMAKELQRSKASKVKVALQSNETPIHILHNNFPASSNAVLRNIIHENNRLNQTDRDIYVDLQNIARELVAQDIARNRSNTPCEFPGFIREIKTFPFQVFLCSAEQILTASSLMVKTKNVVKIIIDSTGGVVRPFVDQETKPLLTAIVLKVNSLTPFVIADMISCRNTALDYRSFISFVFRAIYQQSTVINRPHLFVCDFSFAIIHGILEGINVMTIDVYLSVCNNVFTKAIARFPSTLACVFICTAHVMKALQGNLSRKVKDKNIKKLAMFTMARLVEVRDASEYCAVERNMFAVFGLKNLKDETQLEALLAAAKSVTPEIVELFSFDDGLVVPDEDDFNLKTQKGKSKFYQRFCSSRKEFLDKPQSLLRHPNPYYCPAVLDIFENTYIAYLPLWSRCVIQTKDGLNDFVRETSGAVEEKFKDYKSNYYPNCPMKVTTFAMEHSKIMRGSAISTCSDALRKGLLTARNFNKIPSDAPPPDPTNTLNANETWKYGTSKHHKVVSKFLQKKAGVPKKTVHIPNTRIVSNKSFPVSYETDSSDDDDFIQPTRNQIRPSLNQDYNSFITTLSRVFKNLDPILLPTRGNDAVFFEDFAACFNGSRYMDMLIVNRYIKYLRDEYSTHDSNAVILNCEACYYTGSLEPRSFDYSQLFSNDSSYADIKVTTEEIYHVLFIKNHWVLLKFGVKSHRGKFNVTVESLNPLEGDGYYANAISSTIATVNGCIKSQFQALALAAGVDNLEVTFTSDEVMAPQQDDMENCGPACLNLLECYLKGNSPDDQIEMRTRSLNDYKYFILTVLLQMTELGVKILEHCHFNVRELTTFFKQNPS